MKTRMNVGISSLILIFIVLCLVTFGLLSMSSARNDLTMAERNGDSVKEYYRADGEGERFIAMIDGKLKSAADPDAQGPQDIPESSIAIRKCCSATKTRLTVLWKPSKIREWKSVRSAVMEIPSIRIIKRRKSLTGICAMPF